MSTTRVRITQARLFDDNAAIRRRQRAMLERWVRSLVLEVASEACDAATDEVVAAQLDARATLRHAMAAAGVLDAMPLAFGSKRHTDRADTEPARPRRPKRRAGRAAAAARSSAAAAEAAAAAGEQVEAFVPAAGVACECFYAGARARSSRARGAESRCPLRSRARLAPRRLSLVPRDDRRRLVRRGHRAMRRRRASLGRGAGAFLRRRARRLRLSADRASLLAAAVQR